jgi:predicted DCC family thiol-disulfide oxidoreductase YuxK
MTRLVGTRAHRSPTLVALYDHACPLCRTELLALKATDTRNQLTLINIRSANFDAHAWGFAPEALETTLHVRDAAGHWHIGMDAIRLLFRVIGSKSALARVLNQTDLPGVRTIFDQFYSTLARNRVGVSRLLTGYLGYRASAAAPFCERDSACESAAQCANDEVLGG